MENHSLKPYKRRVLGTYVLLAETLELLGREKASLRKATETDQQRRPKSIPLAFERDQASSEKTVSFKGIGSQRFQGRVSGAEVVRWTGQPVV